MNFVGLDFGTSNSSIARVKDGRVEFFELDPGATNAHMLRSFIFIDREHTSLVGAEAIGRYQELETGRPVFWASRSLGQVQMVVGGGGSPIIYWDDLMVQIDTAARGRLVQSIKTALRNPGYEGTEVFERYYKVEDLIAILLKALRERSEIAIGAPVDGVVIGRPVKFSFQTEVDARAQGKIEAAARLAGFSRIEFACEPVAAAVLYHHETPKRQVAMVFDFGGGTLDLTIVELGGRSEPQIIATRGVLLGGDDLDRTMMQPLKPRFGEGATLRNRTPLPAHLMGMLDNWQTMVLLSRPEYRSILADARRGSDPQSIERLETLVTRNLGFRLFQEIELAKIRLSDKATALVNLQSGGLNLNETFTRPQFERLIARFVAQVETEIDALLQEAGLKAESIDALLRTGGSAEIPAFVRMLGNKFGHDRLRAMNPFESIVGGLGILAERLTS